jgi:hypothetical protein
MNDSALLVLTQSKRVTASDVFSKSVTGNEAFAVFFLILLYYIIYIIDFII